MGLPPVSTPERVNDYLVNYAHQNNLTLPPNYSAKTHASQDEFLGFLEQYQKNFLKEWDSPLKKTLKTGLKRKEIKKQRNFLKISTSFLTKYKE